MALVIHFFRKNNLEKLDFSKVLEYFENQPNFKIYYVSDYVEIAYEDREFSFKYRYLITKQNRVPKIYELSPMYTNINFLLEMPVLIPSFLAKEILTITQKLCKIFELSIYHDSFEDVQNFNLVDVLVLFENVRSSYIADYGLQNKITYDNEKLNIICKYQRSVDSLSEHYQNNVDVNYCTPIISEDAGLSGISYTWKFGNPTVFPPYVDFFFVEIENETLLLKREDFYRILSKYFTEIKTFLPDLYVIKGKQAKSVKKELKKLRKHHLNIGNFTRLRLCDVIEE
ncbi:MAG TPA: hypothetical protein GXZ48_07045 [Acholeplasmataceae bacterium]|jgi:hypothetical protein|nr:hypothetical protein [Acholeplasmataceae bacterium]